MRAVGCRSHRRRGRRARYALALALAGAALAGCGEDRYKPPARSGIARAIPAASPAPADPDPATTPAPIVEPLSASLGVGAPALTEFSGKDLVAKADVYWKIHGLAEEVKDGSVRPDVPSALLAIAKDARGIAPDRGTAMIDEILRDAQSAVDAQRAEAQMRGLGIDPTHVPWGAGSSAVEASVAHAAAPGRRGAGHTALPSVRVRQMTEAAGAWESEHHASPAEVRRRRLAALPDKAEALGDLLDRERRIVGQHPIGRQVAGVPRHADYEDLFPTDQPLR